VKSGKWKVESGKLRGENSMAIVQSYTEQSLTLSDGKSLSPFQTRKLEKITDRDLEYQTRGWISIFEDETETEKETAAEPVAKPRLEAKKK
jgi:hypothetical protein